ncbi:DUF934 domain-containing protein [Burkholderia diffusa]|uniref:DUF934 domain-containing protein n=1 Tax=Burkholderia diffusa TaxID=488732 RepID=UPI0009BCD12E|nr:DUF934 domain-containing protein [Burkholderia diffusa]
MSALPYLDHAALLTLAAEADGVTQPCICMKTPLAGWTSLPLSLRDTKLVEVATLAPPGDPEPSDDEFHPAGTRYWSDDAPIAPRHFPYNRCNVSRCMSCGRLFLRYQEGGGYFIDQLLLMARTGFSSAVLGADTDLAAARLQLDRFPGVYQRDAGTPSPRQDAAMQTEQ